MDKYLTRSDPNTSLVSKRPREDTTPPDKWKLPKKFSANPKDAAKDKRTPVSNRFSALPVDDTASDLFQNAVKKKAVNNTPPIIIELVGEWTHQSIRNTLEKYVKDFHVQHRSRKTIRVQCYSGKSHQDLKDGLVKEKVVFHTFTRKDEKLPKAVIKGLPKFVHTNIPEELSALGFSGATTSEVKTLYPSECPPVLVQLPCGTNMTKFKQIKYLSNCVIVVERYKPTKKPGTQCFRCQGFGHASRNCNRQARCVKCAQAHPTWECTKKDRDTPARCCNCQQDHPANYAQCEERLKYITRIESRREKTLKTLAHKPARDPLSVPQTWAKVTSLGRKQASKPQTDELSSIIDSPVERPAKPPQPTKIPTFKKYAQPTLHSGATSVNIPQDFETVEMLEILATIQSIKQEFTKCKSFMDKVILIVTHLGHYV